MNYKTHIFSDGTEPTVLRCHGPCDQGRKPCPCPAACEAREDEEQVDLVFLWAVVAILTVTIIAIGVAIWGRYA